MNRLRVGRLLGLVLAGVLAGSLWTCEPPPAASSQTAMDRESLQARRHGGAHAGSSGGGNGERTGP